MVIGLRGDYNVDNSRQSLLTIKPRCHDGNHSWCQIMGVESADFRINLAIKSLFKYGKPVFHLFQDFCESFSGIQLVRIFSVFFKTNCLHSMKSEDNLRGSGCSCRVQTFLRFS